MDKGAYTYPNLYPFLSSREPVNFSQILSGYHRFHIGLHHLLYPVDLDIFAKFVDA